MKKNKFHNKTLTIVFITAFIIFMLAGSKFRISHAEANDVVYKTILSNLIPTPTPIKEVEEKIILSPGVVETIRWAFQDKGEKVIQEAIRVAKCESGLRPDAVNDKNKNKSRDDGTFQINSVHGVNPRFLKDYRVNIMVARKLYDEQGWTPWVCARKLGIVK